MAREEIRIELTAEDDASRKIEDVAEEADDLEGLDPKVTVDAETAEAEARLAQFRDEADRAANAAEGIGDAGKRGAGLAGNAMSDMTGPLGDASSAASDFGGVLDGISDTAVEMASRFGATEQTIGRMASGLGLAGFAVAGAAAVWGIFQERQKKANERIKEATDLLRDAAAEGISAYAQKATELIQTNTHLADSMTDLGLTGGDLSDALAGDVNPAVTDAVRLGEDYAKVLDRTAQGSSAQAAALEELAAAHGMTTDELRDAAGASDEFSDALGDQVPALERGAERLETERDLLRDVDGAAGGAAERARDMTAAYEDLHDELSDRATYLDVQQGFDDVKAAADAAFIAAALGSADAEQAARDHERAVLDLQGTVADYGEEVAGLPIEQTTDINAAIDQGSLTTAEAELAKLEKARTAHLNIAQGSGWGLLDRLPGGGWGSSNTTNITVNAPRGTRPADMIAAAQAHGRRNGRRP